MTESSCLTPDGDPHPVAFAVPAGAWDTHVHAIGPVDRYPLAAGRSYTPAHAPIERYVGLMDRLGLARAVLVQPSIYGNDNRAMVDALIRHPSRFRGIAVVRPDIGDGDLRALHDAGVRGVRANLLNRGGISFADACALSQRLAAFGWHLQLQIDVSTFEPFDAIRSLPVDVVVDHFGYMPAGKGVSEPGFQRLLRIVGAGRCWVKLSAAYRLTQWRAHGYGAVEPLARALIDANPHRMLWGSDWPHTDIREDMPNDGDLLGLLDAWAPSAATRHDILVSNPGSLYGD